MRNAFGYAVVVGQRIAELAVQFRRTGIPLQRFFEVRDGLVEALFSGVGAPQVDVRSPLLVGWGVLGVWARAGSAVSGVRGAMRVALCVEVCNPRGGPLLPPPPPIGMR